MNKPDIYKILEKYFDSYQISQLLQKQTGLSKSQLFLCIQLPNINNKWLNTLIQFGEKNYPFEYILQKAEFYGLEFYVDERVLIPRNDTEIMVEQCILSIQSMISEFSYVDIGTGSSCIPISVLKNINNSKIKNTYVVDISAKALEVSLKNIISHNLSDNIIQLQGDLFGPLINKISENNSLIITANLPYIKDSDHKNMDNETVQFEPDLALYGGKETGFELYEKLIKQISNIKIEKKIKTIRLFIEIGFDQELYAQEYLKKLSLEFTSFRDNSGLVRCIGINI